jgi:protein-tyrosine phosphatase
MIDTHAHILPAFDDGAKDLSETIKFVKKAASQGVHTILATPHVCDGVFNCSKDAILQACVDLAAVFQKAGISTRVLPGAEVRVNHDLVKEYDKGSLLTLNNAGGYILIELPTMFMANAISMMIRQLRDRGVTPIIAHAERNPMVLNKPELINDFTYNGALVQITAGSLMGDFGKYSLKAAKHLLVMDQVFCMGSDIHPGRKYRMASAHKRLVKWVGKTRADLIIRENPSAILDSPEHSYSRLYMEKTY